MINQLHGENNAWENPKIPPETRADMFCAYQRLARTGAIDGNPLFQGRDREEILARLSTCSDDEFLSTTSTFLQQYGSRECPLRPCPLPDLVSVINTLTEGLADTDNTTGLADRYDPSLESESIKLQMAEYRKTLSSYEEALGVSPEAANDQTLRFFVKKMSSLITHLTNMNYSVEDPEHEFLLSMILPYKIYAPLDIPKTSAFLKMALDVLKQLFEHFTLVEARYRINFDSLISFYLPVLEERFRHAAAARSIVD